MSSILAKLVDTNKLKEEIIKTGYRSIFMRWRDTAIEVKRDKTHQIYNIYSVYKEISEAELTPNTAIRFIESILEAVETEEEQIRLIDTEARHCKLP